MRIQASKVEDERTAKTGLGRTLRAALGDSEGLEIKGRGRSIVSVRIKEQKAKKKKKKRATR